MSRTFTNGEKKKKNSFKVRNFLNLKHRLHPKNSISKTIVSRAISLYIMNNDGREHDSELSTLATTNREPERTALEYPEGGTTAWVVVAGASMMLACTFGMMSTVGVLQSYWETHQLKNYTSSTIGWIPSIFIFLNLVLGLQVGPMFDRYGPRWIMLVGSVCYTLCIFLLGSCQQYYQFMICLAFGGASSALVSTPGMAILSHWFCRRRGTATGIAMAGSSLGGITFPLILRKTLEKVGWGWALRILGLIFFVLLAIGNICVRSRLPMKPRKGIVDLRCFTDSRFIWTTVGAFFSEIVLFASLGLIPTYAISQGFGPETGVYLLVVLNAGSAFGRWLSGTASDYWGRFNTMTVMMAITTVFIFVLWYPFGHFIGVLYPFAFLLGFGTGSILSLTPVCVGQICGTEEFGQWFGTCYFVASFGTLIGIPIGGQLLDVAGPSRLIAFLGGILGLACMSFVVARWACLEYHWNWQAKV
ncbi:unnamed protein product [Penicillium salamii]|nr:unnamed protein product [Penicillium salamii]CAG8247623.1 unnamed protein product [Penicillium salamii]CAG8305280.1 unnamed protein product [Penicillium salamii]CAG8324426.1 unnamed protein product [Penicillium salamii]CAG8343489.1 unnamed protein product [Penicillium salamii]